MNPPVLDYARSSAAAELPRGLRRLNVVAAAISFALAVTWVATRKYVEAAAAVFVLNVCWVGAHAVTVLPITLWRTRHLSGRPARRARWLVLLPAAVLLAAVFLLGLTRLIVMNLPPK